MDKLVTGMYLLTYPIIFVTTEGNCLEVTVWLQIFALSQSTLRADFFYFVFQMSKLKSPSQTDASYIRLRIDIAFRQFPR